MDNLNFNNSFPCYFTQEKYFKESTQDVEMEGKNNLSAFNLDFLKYFENIENVNNNLNFSPSKKKNSLDMSDSIEQTFCENSHMNIEEEFQNEETCKIYNNSSFKNRK